MLTFSLSPNPLRKKFAEGWPSSAEDNLERLKSCGFPMDRLVPKCDNCGEMGHIRKHCKAEATEPAGRVTITCFNCNGTGHRARDCTEERVNHNLCRNCKQPGHKAADCPEPRSAEGVECRCCGEMGHYSRDCPNSEHKSMACHNCGEEGHKAADCDKPRVITCRNCGKEGHTARECEEPKNPANFTCRNCEKTGHFTRDCPEPKDWSKVQCRNCGECTFLSVVLKVLELSLIQMDIPLPDAPSPRTIQKANPALILATAFQLLMRVRIAGKSLHLNRRPSSPPATGSHPVGRSLRRFSWSGVNLYGRQKFPYSYGL